MSLIIKGMEMPEFPAFRENDNKVSFPAAVVLVKGRAPRLVINYKIGYADTNIRSYELLELPTPHGRLIDADDLDSITVISYPNNRDPFVAGRLKKIIAPTIIEAEVSE